MAWLTKDLDELENLSKVSVRTRSGYTINGVLADKQDRRIQIDLASEQHGANDSYLIAHEHIEVIRVDVESAQEWYDRQPVGTFFAITVGDSGTEAAGLRQKTDGDHYVVWKADGSRVRRMSGNLWRNEPAVRKIIPLSFDEGVRRLTAFVGEGR